MNAVPARWERRNAVSLLGAGRAAGLVPGGHAAPSPLYPIYQYLFGFSTLTITAIYAAYAVGGIGGLVTCGRVSDYVGRRPSGRRQHRHSTHRLWLLPRSERRARRYTSARILHGLGVGIGVGALSAWLVDLQPVANPRLGGLIAGISAMLGLGVGGIRIGLARRVRAGSCPPRLRCARRDLCSRTFRHLHSRLTSQSAAPIGWAPSHRTLVCLSALERSSLRICRRSLGSGRLAGLYVSLGPTLAISVLGQPSPTYGGLVIFLLLGTGAITSVFVRDRDATSLVARGSTVLIGGVAVTLVGLALNEAVVFFAGTFIAGLGFGPAFSAIVRSLTPLAPPDRRAALLAAIFVGVYLSFSLPDGCSRACLGQRVRRKADRLRATV